MRKIWISVLILSLLFLGMLSLAGCQWTELPAPQIAVPSKVYDAQGQLIGSLYAENREEVKLEEIAPFFLEAVVAIEDTRFYQHLGLDPRAILRAVVTNLQAQKIVEGGSTITQQTAKNLYLTPERTWDRKLKEIYYALSLEQHYTKPEILTMYVNRIYFGHGAYGIQMASRTYFGKAAKDLTDSEAALLAGIIRSPGNYSPFLKPEGARNRRDVVLNRMVELGRLTTEEAERIKLEPIQVDKPDRPSPVAAYVLDEIREHIVNTYPDGANRLYNEGLTIYTTLDLKMQQAAEEAFAAGLKKYDPELEGALVALDPATGAIRALVGGRDYSRSKFNRAFQAKRQPGSAFKPFLYTALIDWGFTPARMVTCEPTAYPQTDGSAYQPSDYGDNPYHYQAFTLKEALMISDNVIAVKLNHEIGPAVLREYAVRMGIRSELKPYLSLALGSFEVSPLELAGAYAPLASGGYWNEPFYIQRIIDINGRILEEHEPAAREVIDARSAYIVTDMLKGVLMPGGTGAHLKSLVQRPAAGKTGTTQELKDAWFVGYTPELVTAVYLGYDRPERPVGAGGKVAGPIWANFTREALKEVPVKEFNQPVGITSAKICLDSGTLATASCPRQMPTAFRTGTEPLTNCPLHAPFWEQFWPRLEAIF